MPTSKKKPKSRQRSGSPANKARVSANRQSGKRPSVARLWIGGARLRTLPLAIAPVALGAGAATLPGHVDPLLVALCLAVALFLQIGVNYSNDYSDGVRGTDEFRVGPARLTASGLVAPRAVLTVALSFFALAAVAGLAIVIITGLYWLLAVGAVAIVAAWFYTGGKRPYGYSGLGEVFVFLFFGLVATLGTQYVLVNTITFEGVVSAVAIGAISCAVLMSNNLRDIDQDKLAGKKTLSVRVGRTWSKIIYLIFMIIPYLVLGALSLLYPLGILVFFTLLLAIPAVVIVFTAKTPKELILALQLTSFTGLLYGLGLAAALTF